MNKYYTVYVTRYTPKFLSNDYGFNTREKKIYCKDDEVAEKEVAYMNRSSIKNMSYTLKK